MKSDGMFETKTNNIHGKHTAVMQALQEIEKTIDGFRKQRFEMEKNAVRAKTQLKETKQQEQELKKKLNALLKQENQLMRAKQVLENKLEKIEKKMDALQGLERRMRI